MTGDKPKNKDEDVTFNKSLTCFIYLFEKEIFDSCFYISKHTLLILTGKKRAQLLSETFNMTNLKVKMKVNVASMEDMDAACQALEQAVAADGVTSTCMLVKECQSLKMEWSQKVRSFSTALKVENLDHLYKKLLTVKDAKMVDKTRISAEFTNIFTQVAISDIESWFEADKAMVHNDIAINYDLKFQSDFTRKASERISKKLNLKVDPFSFDIGFSPLFQSGGHYDLKISVTPDSNKLSWDLIRIVLCYKYDFYYSCASRIILINASEERKQNYEKLTTIVEAVPLVLKIGKVINEIYNELKESFVKQFPGQEVQKIFGHGIGLEFKEKLLEITENNYQKVEKHQTFVVFINVNNLSDKSGPYSLQVMNTYVVGETQTVNTNERISSKLNDISYMFEDDEEADEEAEVAGEVHNVVRTRRRDKKDKEVDNEKKRQPHQAKLRKEKTEEIKQRYEDGELIIVKKSETIELNKIHCYKNEDDLEKDLKRKVYLDEYKDCVLIPVESWMVPFHLATIRNIKVKEEGSDLVHARFNFIAPNLASSLNIKFPEYEGNVLYISSIQMRGNRELKQICSKIEHKVKDFRTRLTNRNSDTGTQDTREKLVTARDTIVLDEVSIKPKNGASKRNNQGIVQAHKNFLHFIPKQGEKIVVLYRNIKHAIFQDGHKELTVLVHIRLRKPIKINGRNVDDLQFYKEIYGQSEEVGKRYTSEQDELRQEENERRNMRRLNKQFLHFCDEATRVSDGLFTYEVPYRDISFNGIYNRNYVKVSPTDTCLVNLSEIPVMIIALEEVDYVFFERISTTNVNRQFDITLINKDYSKLPFQISSVENTSLDLIKDYLNDKNLIYAETTQTLNWDSIMKDIRANPDGFIEEGCWEWAHEESEQDSQEPDKITDEDDSAFTDVDNADDDEDDFEGDDDDSEDYQESEIEDGLAEDEDEEAEGDEKSVESDRKRKRDTRDARPNRSKAAEERPGKSKMESNMMKKNVSVRPNRPSRK